MSIVLLIIMVVVFTLMCVRNIYGMINDVRQNIRRNKLRKAIYDLFAVDNSEVVSDEKTAK